MSASTIIPIHAANTAAHQDHDGCSACLDSAAGPVCRSDMATPCITPALQGPAEELQRVMQALDQALAVRTDGGLGASGLIHSLRLDDGEVELMLTVAPRCGGARLADSAFQALRRLLPDTDIYVRHAC
ncbi:MAG: hypothetical protein CFE46_12590 [Burkholderiales bacterium PBB6]|nr:MAG: hypothetical protein CFE46_12590 [Burkholderiales bacterium PBB6]